MYLAIVIDLFSRQVVGWAMGERMTRHLVIDALTMAWFRRQPAKGLIFHSDQGSQYASTDFQATLRRYGMCGSMSRRGNCWDNAVNDAEQRFQGVIAQGVELLALRPLQMVDHRFDLCRIVRRGRRLGEAGRSRMDDGTAAPGAINGVIPEAPQAITLAALK
ncbi:transposase InsO family protein [Skermanella aerolata]